MHPGQQSEQEAELLVVGGNFLVFKTQKTKSHHGSFHDDANHRIIAYKDLSDILIEPYDMILPLSYITYLSFHFDSVHCRILHHILDC